MSSRASPGPLVTTSGQVISGAGSPGQQVWIGSCVQIDVVAARARSPGRRGLPTVLGLIASTVLASGSSSSGFAEAARRLGLAQLRQQLAHFAQIQRVGALDAAHGHAHGDALDRAEQIDQHRHVAEACRRP